MINSVTLYTKPNCSFCTTAKSLLTSAQIPFEEKKLDVHFTREHLKQLYPSAVTYPVVIVDGYNIGGARELRTLLESEYKDPRQLLNEA